MTSFELRVADPADAPRIALWMQRPHIVRWWQQDWCVERWAQEIERQVAGEHSTPYVVAVDGEEFAYVEVYRVRHDRLAKYYVYGEDDRGVHVAIGDVSRVGRGLGKQLLRSLAEQVFLAEPACAQVVAEPDIDNVPSVRAFTAAGFVQHGELRLPEKTALLMVRTRAAQGGMTCTT
ncbi:GNAT family N-acetyltransferase [Kribbella sp. NPDC048915]|uniref:GNAT family N-acetyltransferase n=1 Tax=Kribbella sp. NPDC048915 TaxID=3155148 RepID=UPI00340B16FD